MKMDLISVNNVGVVAAFVVGYRTPKIWYLLKGDYESGESFDYYTSPASAYIAGAVAIYALTQGAPILSLAGGYAVGQIVGWGGF